MSECIKLPCLDITIPSRNELGVDILEASVLGKAVMALFEKSVDNFYLHNWLECYKLSDALLDYTWEQLNIGHWKDVHLSWRHIYSYASILKATSSCKYYYIIYWN